MKAGFFEVVFVSASLAGCASDYVPPPPAAGPGPEWSREQVPHERPGLFGDLRWNVDPTGKREPVRVSEEADFKKWQESKPSDEERREFEEWRAWQEWKRKNPK